MMQHHKGFTFTQNVSSELLRIGHFIKLNIDLHQSIKLLLSVKMLENRALIN